VIKCDLCDATETNYRSAYRHGWGRSSNSTFKCLDCRRELIPEPTVRVSFQIPISLRDKMDATGRSRGEIIRAALREWFDGQSQK
jgi:hypothetical protein